ncbi:hypothetical protein [Anaerotignum sp.]
MAEKAFHVLKDGSIVEVLIGNVTDEIKHDIFLCSGCEGACKAEVIPVREGPRPCFRIKRGQHHKSGCQNDESLAAQIRRVLDHTGHTTSIEELYELFDRPQVEVVKKEKRKGTKENKVNDQDDEEEFDDIRAIQRELKNPKNLRELCALFSKSSLDDIYAGMKIGDIFLDHRNIADIRKKGIPEGQLAIVLCAKISVERIKKLVPEVPDQAIVLGDAYSYADKEKQLLCIIPCTANAKRIIFNSDSKKKIIAVFGRWHQDPFNKSVYTCEPIKEGRVFCAEESFYEW